MHLVILTCVSIVAAAVDGPLENKTAPTALQLPADNRLTQSVGHPFTGRLVDGVRLPATSRYHMAQRSTRLRNWLYGTGYLVRGILSAARTVDRTHPGGQPLVVGNLSKRGGGDIKLSVSHNSGRDVDFAYYVVTSAGLSAPSDYHRFGPDGLSRTAPKEYQFDRARNWTLIKAFVNSTEVEVQWIIVAPHLKNLLLEYARSIGEPATLVSRAATMMYQPTYAKMHDNHLHLRVLCSTRDWRRRCLNGGPVWSWNKRMLGAFNALRSQVRKQLVNSNPRKRLTGLSIVEKRGLYTAVPDVEPLLHDTVPRVAKRALNALLALSSRSTAMHLMAVAGRQQPAVAFELISRNLLLAEAHGLPVAQALVDGTHPALEGATQRKRRRLLRTARRLLKRYASHRPAQPGAPSQPIGK